MIIPGEESSKNYNNPGALLDPSMAVVANMTVFSY
jgi:hypothetical protein